MRSRIKSDMWGTISLTVHNLPRRPIDKFSLRRISHTLANIESMCLRQMLEADNVLEQKSF